MPLITHKISPLKYDRCWMELGVAHCRAPQLGTVSIRTLKKTMKNITVFILCFYLVAGGTIATLFIMFKMNLQRK
jgi:hypothetical protein